MQPCLSPEAKTELELFKELDRDVGIALEASIGMLAWIQTRWNCSMVFRSSALSASTGEEFAFRG
jgi:hypothetical protein